jgi:hypothetical protein
MANIFGHLNIADTDRVFASTPGQAVIWDAVQDYVSRYNAGLNAAMAIFVEGTTSDFKRRYKLPGGGYMQRRGPDGRPAARKRIGQWDIGLPLEDFGDAVAWNDVALAYMTAQEFTASVQSVLIANTNTTRYEMLKALLNNTQRTFKDELNGDILVEPLANGDAVVYPPVEGSVSEATDTHYLESNYASSAISDTNNPFKTVVAELQEHFGGPPTGGAAIAAFHNPAQTAKIEALTDFVEVPDRFVRLGDDDSVPVGLPSVPGRVIGRVNGAWSIEWPWIPADYMYAQHLEAPAPLLKRVDPADTGLGEGLQLVAVDDAYPFAEAFWRSRFGFGVGNRLNGVVLEFGTGGSYTVPTGY